MGVPCEKNVSLDHVCTQQPKKTGMVSVLVEN